MQDVNFEVVEKKLKTVDGIDVPHKAIVRADNNMVLGVMGEDYKLVKHSDVLDQIESKIPTTLQNRRINICKSGAIMFAKYETPRIQNVEVKKGDIVKFGIEIFNSYDGSLPVGFMFTALRLVCTNGMTIPKSIARICVRHTAGLELDNIKEAFANRLPLYMGTANKWREWTNITPKADRVQSFFKDRLGKRLSKQFEENYKKAEDKSLWGLYNLFTYHCTHDIKVRAKQEQNKRLAQFNFEKNVINDFYSYKWN